LTNRPTPTPDPAGEVHSTPQTPAVFDKNEERREKDGGEEKVERPEGERKG